MALIQDRKQAKERLRHAAWSGLIALVLSMLGLFTSIDQVMWILQARHAGFEASGDIVFVRSEEDLTDRDFPQRREELARAIHNLKRAGTRGIYLDMAFERPSRATSDGALRQALLAPGADTFLIRNLVSGFGSEGLILERTTPAVGAGVRQLAGDREFFFMGIVWQMPYLVEHDGVGVVSAAAALADVKQPRGATFPINYGFELESIPTVRLSQIAGTTPRQLATRFSGKQVVIGRVGADVDFVMPGDFAVPGAMVHIYAAETLKAGFVRSLPSLHLLLAGLAILGVAALTRRRAIRRVAYVGLAAFIPACLAITMVLGVRPNLSGLLVFLLAYFALRLRVKWKKGILLFDQDTGLPTFAALQEDRQVATGHPTIIVAKLHRFEEVRQSLAADLHAEYVLRIADRLKAASPDTKIYLGTGHSIAWCMAEEEPGLVKDHLEGLRALFASPLQVGGEQVDVGITFGVDISPSNDVGRRLANAVAAAERTTETYLPIVIAEAKSEDELIWNISLQARIDGALANDEIFLVYQPKISIDTGEMMGIEALVRWRDPVRGLITPDRFINQCEETGRMGHLTRHVLRQACRAGADIAQRGVCLSIAVNISATLLHDAAIVAMVREVIEETGIDPRRLTLEITETYRISEMCIAGSSLSELAAMGITISMDDFGVGAASFEALLQLPFTELKIDRVFIDRLTERPRALGIVRSILELGRQLRVRVVAEGVEDEATLELLRQAGCPLAQGYGICRPVPLEEAVLFRNRSVKLKSA